MYEVLSVVVPVFFIAFSGYIYGRWITTDIGEVNRINLDLFVPALLIYVLSEKMGNTAGVQEMLLAGSLVVAGSGLIAWPASRWLKIDFKTLAPPMMFNNSANIGLPLAVLAWGEDALPAAVILFMVENTLHFSFGARLLNPETRLLTLWRIPVVFAAIAGLTVAILKIPIWQPLVIAIKMLGDVSVPLLLFSLGVRMTDVSFREWKVATGSAILRPLAGMLIAVGVIQLLGLQGREAAMLLVFGALPPAVLNFLFAERYNQEPERVASIVLIGNLAALLFLPLALALVL